MALRRPSTIGGACYLTVLAVAAAGLIVVATGHWRAGVDLLAASLLGSALARGVLPEDEAGMLQVRSKFLDVSLLIGVGGVLIWLASTVPNAG
ncbi:hypothetical protein Back2_09190 [Nocardioides baekrokdamisoli]|uniref:DUF3017 domain-containing protein n=1 Tax=Nocardioides baekrokdamisoli TaxID=1804624 RepID=A0A3G9IE41_9ACTN|nr:DUF3017 domain-containing protein [Nocardioides baekrokdamisoli]BBH16632.1 hypothetical protein Back2_09190 [Nocardioides baekrokdamisoli]